MRIYLIGFMGCGKTHWGKELSSKLQFPFFDLDEAIEENTGMSVTNIFAELGEEQFRLREKELLYTLTESHGSFVLACGGGTPCFYNNIDYMKSRGTTVWINCSVATLFTRLVNEKEKRPLIAALTDAELKAFIVKKYADRRIFYRQADVIVNEEEASLDKLIESTFHA